MAKKQLLSQPDTLTIETPVLNIRKNLMIWQNTLIQLSNVSYISTMAPESLPFPSWTVGLLMLGGLFLFLGSRFSVFGIILIGCSAVFLRQWSDANEKRRAATILSIRMNSGQTLDFKFHDKEFMSKVMAVLEQIMLNGGTTRQNIEINIKDSVISKSNVLNDLTAHV